MHIIIIVFILDRPSIYAYHPITFAVVPICSPVNPATISLTFWNVVCWGVL
jgi:hypothetical protein